MLKPRYNVALGDSGVAVIDTFSGINLFLWGIYAPSVSSRWGLGFEGFSELDRYFYGASMPHQQWCIQVWCGFASWHENCYYY